MKCRLDYSEECAATYNPQRRITQTLVLITLCIILNYSKRKIFNSRSSVLHLPKELLHQTAALKQVCRAPAYFIQAY